MGYHLIKPDRDIDFYVHWSSYEDKPIGYGAWKEFVDEDPVLNNEDRFERLQEYGTSAYLRDHDWESDRIIMGNMGTMSNWWCVPRKDFAEFVREYGKSWPLSSDKEEQQRTIDRFCTEFHYED